MKNKNKNKKPFMFRFFKGLVRVFYMKREFIGLDNLPKEPSIIISNHAQMNGPISMELFFPSKRKIWCIGEMMNIKEVPNYAFQDFWSKKPRYIRWLYRIISYLIAPVGYLLKNADTIAVYKDSRIITTFKETVQELNNGCNVIIFPESVAEYNHIVNDFQDKFIDVAKLYYKKYNKELYFVPMYNAAKLKKIVIGKPIKFDHTLDMTTQREVICSYLKEVITKLAIELPPHRVVPYLNIKKRKYPLNKKEESL